MNELGHQVDLEISGDNLQGLDDVLMAEIFCDLALPQGPVALLRAVDRDDLDSHLSNTFELPETTFSRVVHETSPPHGCKAPPADHLHQRVASLAGAPAAYVVCFHRRSFYIVMVQWAPFVTRNSEDPGLLGFRRVVFRPGHGLLFSFLVK